MLPKDVSYAQRFQIARDAGFDTIEMQTIGRDDEAAEIRDASTRTGLRIHSVMNMDHWQFPLSSGDRDVVTLEHAVEMTRLVPKAQLAVFPSDHGSYLGEATSVRPDGPLPVAFWVVMREFLDEPAPGR